ncbi:MAG: methylenetetrahydrofolate reductase, partial [Candidatus Micrarchaeota archaeon]
MFQLTCRDRNILALQSELLSASALGIENVLALTGDHPSVGEYPKAKAVFDLDAVRLLKLIEKMNSGEDANGKELEGRCSFFSGAALAPNVSPIEPEVLKTKKKIESGAKFFQTQAIYDLDELEKFLEIYERECGGSEELRKCTLAGTVLLHSQSVVNFLKTLPGVKISEEVEAR